MQKNIHKRKELNQPYLISQSYSSRINLVFVDIQKLTRNGQNLKCNLNCPRTRHSPLTSIKGGNSNSKRMGIVSPGSTIWASRKNISRIYIAIFSTEYLPQY